MNICTSDFQSWQYQPLGGGGRLQESAEKLYWCGRTGGALHDSPITSQLTQRLHRSLGYVITTLICNCKESNIIKSGRDLSYHNSHQSWLCSNATSGVENFTNFKALLHSGKVKKCTMMVFKSIVII
ncbi:hypothetical protein T09_5533 [Trichinella sp. T9]|nr:hypothetical protein T09_5533 [Trichinella sp. T9]